MLHLHSLISRSVTGLFLSSSGRASYTHITCLSTFSMSGSLLFLNDTNMFLLLCNYVWAQDSHFLSKATDSVPCLKQQPARKRKHITGGKLIILLWNVLQWQTQHQCWGNILFFPMSHRCQPENSVNWMELIEFKCYKHPDAPYASEPGSERTATKAGSC